MRKRLLEILACVSIGAFVAAGPAWAEAARNDTGYKPEVGQDGKDVVWVPTSQELVDIMLDMAQLQPGDKLVDLGSGDGRTVISAAKRGIQARGIEYNPDLVALANSAARQENVADMALFEQADIFESDFSEATVVTLFLLPKLNMRLRPTLLSMPPGTRVVSNSFLMEDWEPDETRKAGEDCSGHCIAHKWVVPAKIEGTWQLEGKKLLFTQKFQKLEGEVVEGDNSTPITDAQLNGTRLVFNVAGQRYEGEVDGDQIQGTIAGKQAWKANRTSTATS